MAATAKVITATRLTTDVITFAAIVMAIIVLAVGMIVAPFAITTWYAFEYSGDLTVKTGQEVTGTADASRSRRRGPWEYVASTKHVGERLAPRVAGVESGNVGTQLGTGKSPARQQHKTGNDASGQVTGGTTTVRGRGSATAGSLGPSRSSRRHVATMIRAAAMTEGTSPAIAFCHNPSWSCRAARPPGCGVVRLPRLSSGSSAPPRRRGRRFLCWQWTFSSRLA